ncbi:MAG: polysaccharide export protein [Burkholderiaceae bacterium]|jgi:polysaccharide export outer membrane protein|nr:polysaccharide biosynthesis/export family protein [Burkholderiales bacterium]MCZ8108149.1 polysaccharide export protein [Burkholderiales bacterium]MCZ8337314.1 polysaccharide export protein [Burkholderiaceae bacterium]
MSPRLSFVVVPLAALVLAGCASSSLPPAPVKAASTSYQYQVGPGDQLEINVWRHPELSARVPVRPDGKVTSPLIEDLVAVGKSPAALAREIEQRLARYIREPSVTVLVTTFVGNSSEQVRVVGQAARPAALPYKQNMTLLDVMIAVGGITEFAAGNRAVLIRQAENNKQYSVRLKDLLKGGDVSANVEVLPGDVIMIPEGLF